MTDLQRFHAEFMADIIAEASSVGASADDGVSPENAFKENAFTNIMLEDLETAGVLESPTACYFANTVSRMPFKINAFAFPEEDSRLDLVITDFRTGVQPYKLVGSEIDRNFKLALRFMTLAVEGKHSSPDSGHEEHAMLEEIYSRRESFDRVQLILITNAQVVQRKEKERKEEVGRYKVSYEIWDLERLRRFRSSGSTHEPVMLDLSELKGGGLPCVPVSDDQLGYQTCVSILPGAVLHDWYDTYGTRLLELNVRSYLQAKGKINKEILETLLTKPKQFLAFNNGITIVAEEIVVDATGTILTGIKGLQIVNGGQTTASIHRAKKDNQADLSHVFVQAKITVVPADQFEFMVPEISRLSNTQNKVTTIDLGANNAFHVGVERVAKKTWAPGEQSMWFYERARGGFQTERSKYSGTSTAKRAKFDLQYPTTQRILKEDLARYSNTWDSLPHLVSRGGQKNFERFMSGIKKVEKGWEPDQEYFKALIGKAILYRKTQQIAKELKIKPWTINIVTYTIALLADRTSRRIDLISIWDRQGLSTALTAQMKQWLPKVENVLNSTVGDKNPGEWFKSENCWRNLREASVSWEISKTLGRELVAVGEGYEDVSHEVQSNIARCLQVDAQQWLKIQLWGTESGELVDWQIGIANTLSGYAAQGWKRNPSEKQAKHAVAMLEIYERSHPR